MAWLRRLLASLRRWASLPTALDRERAQRSRDDLDLYRTLADWQSLTKRLRLDEDARTAATQATLTDLAARLQVVEQGLASLHQEQAAYAAQVREAVVHLVDAFNQAQTAHSVHGVRMALPPSSVLPRTLPDERECACCGAIVTIWRTYPDGVVTCTRCRHMAEDKTPVGAHS